MQISASPQFDGASAEQTLPNSDLYVVKPFHKAPLRWYQVSGADILFFVLALVIFQTARQGLLDDPGLGWHLRNIDAMLAKGGWLTVDSFSEPRDGQAQPWYTNQWLGEIPFWLGER